MATKKLLPLKEANAAVKKAMQKDIVNINKFVDKYGQKELDNIVRKIKLSFKKKGGKVKRKK
tara:strand:+ start:305 stop:490 length:186 start_codon:yes stop_codon:yes gene_type:complete